MCVHSGQNQTGAACFCLNSRLFAKRNRYLLVILVIYKIVHSDDPKCASGWLLPSWFQLYPHCSSVLCVARSASFSFSEPTSLWQSTCVQGSDFVFRADRTRPHSHSLTAFITRLLIIGRLHVRLFCFGLTLDPVSICCECNFRRFIG